MIFSISTLLRQAFILTILIVFSACGSQIVEERDDSGNLVATYEVKDEVKHGDYTGFHPDGSVFEQATYVDGQVHGLRALYFEGGKKIKTEETYVHGVMEGVFTDYHLNGNVAFTGSFVADDMDGIWKKYNESSQLIEEVTFRDSEENGPFKEYHINGQLAAEGAYRNGDNEHGPLSIYNEDGELIKKMDCINGICQTSWSKENSK